MLKQAELFDWLLGVKDDQYVLRGMVVNHPTLPDHSMISATSPVVRIKFVCNRYVVHTKSGSTYRLGVPNTEWTKRLPGARQAFIDHFLEKN
jgi:hypothetical protein